LATRDQGLTPVFSEQTYKASNSVVFKMSKLILKYINGTNGCLTGFDFVYEDDSRVSIGQDGTSLVNIDTPSTKPFYSISSSCSLFACGLVQICLNDTLSLKLECFTAGNTQIPPDTVLYTQKFQIKEITGDFSTSSNNNSCIKNLGIFYSLNECDQDKCQQSDANCVGCNCLNANLTSQCTTATNLKTIMATGLRK